MLCVVLTFAVYKCTGSLVVASLRKNSKAKNALTTEHTLRGNFQSNLYQNMAVALECDNWKFVVSFIVLIQLRIHCVRN